MLDVQTPIDVMTTVNEHIHSSSTEAFVKPKQSSNHTKQPSTDKSPTMATRFAPLPSTTRGIPQNILLQDSSSAARRMLFNNVTHESSTLQTTNNDPTNHQQLFTVYLIRHGEASHNVKEKAAKRLALDQAVAEGFAADSEETIHRMEQARRSVLHDEQLFDAPLSRQGRKEARGACNTLHSLIRDHRLPPPQEVLVSPLTRTLETANLVFPENNNIHVREELRERCTGKPPDNRSSSDLLRSRESFKRFSMDRLHNLSMIEFDLSALEDELEDENEDGGDDIISPTSRRKCSISSEYSGTEEDKAMLRLRTRRLFDLLAESKERSIAVVTHKGYLREFERGQLGKPLAGEFKNCEIRVYRILLDVDRASLKHSERLV